ncbi:DUF4926 domain-containing protein [Nodosilinea sp. P-1105]|uniref:DUF4926 domain-containing protein n=1 Tax=Nodosilinea sp. P-1105 TaxID=2546229 RepID=UPI00146D64D3|nr:DUF4926 domain-containing protein [Nodosilinea sp. P-1105]NMF83749.1 DUF4926 domain-containing protein [Nodosilinea sp. P-1105]
MIHPELFDIVELLVDLPEFSLQVGDRGAIVEKHTDTAYEVEFTNAYGETLECLALDINQFMVVWQSKTKSWVPLAQQIATMLEALPQSRQEQVLNFARSLYRTPA